MQSDESPSFREERATAKTMPLPAGEAAVTVRDANVERAVRVLQDSFQTYYRRFCEITARARSRFENREWPEVLRDAEARIRLYHHHLNVIQAAMEGLLGDRVCEPSFWEEIKPRYFAPYASEYHADLALIFFYSVMRRALYRRNLSVEYSDDEIRSTTGLQPVSGPGSPVRTYFTAWITQDLIRQIVSDFAFEVPFADMEADTRLAAGMLAQDLHDHTGPLPVERIEFLKDPFFRNKAAYLVGRVFSRGSIIPLIIVLLNGRAGMEIDSLLTDEADVANVFTSARSNFHTDPGSYREVFDFLKSIAPSRPIPYIYSSIGFIHPAKLQLVRELRGHIARTGERFQMAPGVPGTVMAVFTLPTFHYVFKVIRDTSVKATFRGRRQVVEQYWRVHRMDRVGRMLDVTTFHNLSFARESFAPALLEELLRVAPSTIHVDASRVICRHLYAARDIVPLNVFLADASVPESKKRSAVVDYGFAIKDLAAAGIFVGDYMTKNFGVTRFGRVMLYDYDDLDDLVNWNFRDMPEPPEWAETLAAEDWLSKSDTDVFPEHDFRVFSVPPGYRDVFAVYHEDLLGPEFWNGIKRQLQQGRVPDFFAYPSGRRLRPGHPRL